jgi:hypothetical protein
MATSINDFLQYLPLTKMVETVKTGIPNVLPDAFFSVTEDVFGNKFGRTTFSGTRKLARNAPYLSKAGELQKSTYGTQEVQLLSPKEKMSFRDEFLQIYRQLDQYEPQPYRYLPILEMQTRQLKAHFENLRIAAVTSMLGQGGKIYLDAEGYMLNTSAGADLTLSAGVPNANIGNVGGFYTTSWATSTTDIVTSIRNTKTLAMQTTSYPLKHAFYGKNVLGYVTNNDFAKYYLARNPGMNQVFLDTGDIPQGFMDLTWHPVQDAFFDNAAGVVKELFPADQVTYTPEIDSQVYGLKIGSTPVITNFGVHANPEAALRSATEHKGMGAYSFFTHEPLNIEHIMFDCFYPDLKVPAAFFFADTTP